MNTFTSKQAIQMSIFDSYEFSYNEGIVDAYDRELSSYVSFNGDTTFGFWMQTLADLEFLDLELRGLTEGYSIDPINRTVSFSGDGDYIRMRVAHLEKVNGDTTFYTTLVDEFGDTNAYAFHNLYPYKGKFYPRVVRTLINAFGLKAHSSLLLDPFNGSGTTTHEASLMGIRSVGIDVTPMGVILSKLKNDLLFIHSRELDFTQDELRDILDAIEGRKWQHVDPSIHKLMLVIYFDTIDALTRTTRYNRGGKLNLFIKKFNYIRDCHRRVCEIRDRYGLAFEYANIIEGDVLKLKDMDDMRGSFDACITSPPYYFSIDYIGKDRVVYDYLGVDMKGIGMKHLGKRGRSLSGDYGDLPLKVAIYYEDLRESIGNISWALKPGGKLAMIIGDSTVDGRRIPTTAMTKRFCEEFGLKVKRVIFNPLLGVRNRGIRGESVIICEKEK